MPTDTVYPTYDACHDATNNSDGSTIYGTPQLAGNDYLRCGMYNGGNKGESNTFWWPMMYFNLSGISSSATVSACTLNVRINNQNDNTSSSQKAIIRKITSSWDESSSSAPTWDLSTNYGDIGTASGTWGSGGTAVTSSSITTLVQGWINGTITNYGLFLHCQDSSVNIYRHIGSRTNATSSYYPYLSVTYTTNTAPTTPGSFTTPASDGTNVAVSASTSIAWTASTDAQSDTITYSLEVNRDSQGYIVVYTGTSNSTTIDTSDWAAGSYQFRVRAIDISGTNTYSSYNTARQVNFTRSFTDPTEQIDSGAPDDAFHDATAYSSEKLQTILSDGSYLVTFQGETSTPEPIMYFKKKISGTWQSITNGSIIGPIHGSLDSYVDSGGTERLVFVWSQSGTSGGRVSGGMYLVVGSLNSAKDTVTWGTATRIGSHTLARYPDLVAHAEGSGGMAHVVMSYLESGPINTTFYYPCTISGNTPTIGASQGISPPYEVAGYGYDSHSFPSIDMDPVTGRLGVVWGSGSGGSGTAYNYLGTRFAYADPASLVFFYTGANQTWVVPAGVTEITVDLIGASGGDAYPWTSAPSRGGKGGRVRAKISTTPGETLNFFVGGRGNNGSNWMAGNTGGALGGYNGGGDGGKTGESTGKGAGGGGASDIRRGGTANANRILVAGGGGGAVPTIPGGAVGVGGGHGGGTTGGSGEGNSGMGGSGGTQAAGGAAGGDGVNSTQGNAGTLGNGGNGAAFDFYNNGDGGGGGGGYYGGGGGGTNKTGTISFYNGGGGGGGGSSYVGGATQVINEQGVGSPDGYGQIRVTYQGAATRTWSFITHKTIDQTLTVTTTPASLNYAGNICRWDGSRFIAGVSNSAGTMIYESTDLYTTPTVLLDDFPGNAGEMMVAIDTATQDVYHFYSHHSGEFFSELRYRRYNRTTSSWETPVTFYVGKTDAYTEPFDAQAVFYRGAFKIMLTTGMTSPYQVRTGDLVIPKLRISSPDADILTTGWTTQSGGTTNLYTAVDDTTIGDADYIKSTAP